VVYNQRKDFSKPEDDPLDHPVEWNWAALENGKITSIVGELEFLMRFDGHKVPMSGIAGVGTLPENRKSRGVRAVFEKLLPEAYEKEVIFSCLNPFSHAFYRKFGYEVASTRNEITIPAKEFSNFRIHGNFTPLFPDSDTAPLQEIHSICTANINQSILRDHWPDNRGWKLFTHSDPYATGIFIYLWSDDEGRPRSYIKYQDVLKNDEHIMSVKELMFTDSEALYGILGLVSGLNAQFRQFQWPMPNYLDPTDFIGVAWDINQHIVPRDMTRIVHVKKALELMRHPGLSGSYVVEVSDNMIQQNNQKFLVEYDSKKVNVSVTAKEPDISCDIPSLSQLVTGYRSLENALVSRREGLKVYGGIDFLNKVFTPRPQYITEYF
jgi:predicted acetyltransferase